MVGGEPGPLCKGEQSLRNQLDPRGHRGEAL